MNPIKKLAKQLVRAVGVEPSGLGIGEKKDGGIDARYNKGNCRNPAQKKGDVKRRGPRKMS